MKKILYIGGFELPDKNAAAHRVLAIAKGLRDSGNEVVFMGVSKDNRETDVLKTKSEVQGFITYSVPYPQGNSDWVKYLTDPKPAEKLMKVCGPFDGVICYNYQAVAFDRLRKFCRANKIKIYSDCTEWYNTNGASLPFKILKGFDTWYRMTVVQKKLDGIIVISNYLKNYYKSCKNVVVIPPLVDFCEEKWSVEAENLGEGVNFIYSGQPGKKDKIGEIVTAFSKVAENGNCKLFVVGINKEQFLKSNPQFTAADVPESVAFLGRVPHEQSIAYLKGADCSLIIRDSTRTNNAGFPTKFAEAVTVGVDVIATDISDLKIYSKKSNNVMIVEETLEETMAKFASVMPREKKERKLCDLFDYRKWTKNIEALIG